MDVSDPRAVEVARAALLARARLAVDEAREARAHAQALRDERFPIPAPGDVFVEDVDSRRPDGRQAEG